MIKKILLSGLAVMAVVGGVAAVSAFEAHVINVTAQIENALSVSADELDFGTVFPQEYLEKEFTISLSSSFLGEERVDDVEYIIKQKTKCKLDPNYEGEPLPPYAPVNYWDDQCPINYLPMLPLCDFLSKLPQDEEDSDVGEPSYYDPNTNTCPVLDIPMVAHGKLAKSKQDSSDTWTVDLKVPPFEGYVAQDWPQSCPVLSGPGINPEGTDFGCDLWIEVTNISLPGDELGCLDKADVMLTLDRSGSIGDDLGDLQTAAIAFVNALAPSTDGVHAGEVSFATAATLDVHLTDDSADVIAAINALASSGATNLQEAIDTSAAELANPGDGHDRDDVDSPDYMVIITDGVPTTGGNAAAAAAAAKADGITIYVVGVGAGVDANYLMNEIASSPSHYFGVANFADLEAILEGIAACNAII